MDGIMATWIENRFTRETRLAEGADNLWQKIVASIEECCDSFNEHYRHLGSAHYKATNGHRIVVTITLFGSGSLAVNRTVAVDFGRSQCAIDVSVDGESTITFPMGSDDSSVFVMASEGSMVVDDFSRRVLEKSLFNKP
jgi:hypothetical protein